jgi:hypothetical protein
MAKTGGDRKLPIGSLRPNGNLTSAIAYYTLKTVSFDAPYSKGGYHGQASPPEKTPFPTGVPEDGFRRFRCVAGFQRLLV